MRRSHSLRHQARPSFAAERSNITDDLGVLQEEAESVEDSLRRQLLTKDRENDKLQTQILSLQSQLSQRPPVERIQNLEKEYKNLELLLQGTQRENERCMAELERGKNREKMLERELARLAGENWQTTLDIPPSSASTMRSGFGSTFRNSPTRDTISPAPRSSFERPSEPSDPKSNENTDSNEQSGNSAAAATTEATRAHLEQVRLLVLGMEQRLQTREEKLAQVIQRAETESSRFSTLRHEVDAQ
ncbi:hypothetical protein BD410DRAFT_783477 [Rickenella mellea]|uniref:Uncharacterized protein n=1 Tax=Rickenella mellea TaxID=50990 RepID=A0A4Y7QGP7_9AGAM|nr:hypothetical protein BD410DRAFT_783477 [Rickenella mellea]